MTQRPLPCGSVSDIGVSTPETDFDNLVYRVSHDLRAFVRAFRELPQWVQDDLDSSGITIPQQVADHFQLMRVQTDHLDQFLTDLSTFARIGMAPAASMVALHKLLPAALHDAKVPANWSVNSNIQTPACHVAERDIKDLLVALLSNAVKHHDNTIGTIDIRATQENGFLTLTVADDGPGIPQKYQDRVFDFLTTLKPRDLVEGTGLGLCIARKICTLYGGSLQLTSHPHMSGCTFTARIGLNPATWNCDLT